MSDKQDLLRRWQQNAATITGFGFDRLGLLGSFVRDEAGSESDVDLFVEFHAGEKSLKNIVGLSRFLKELLGRKVELVTPASLNRFTGKHILKNVEYVALAA